MGFLYLVDLDEYPKEDIVHCNICETRIGLANDFIDSIDYEMTVVFHKMYNVQVDEEKYHRQVNGNTVADTYCVKCGMLLGMKLIVVPYSNQTVHHREGNFLMNALELIDCNNKLMYLDETEEDEEYEEQDDADANEHDHDQGGGADEQDHDDDGGANEQDQDEEDEEYEEDGGGANEHDHNQGGGADEQDHDNDGGANEHHHDQGGGTNDQDGVNEHEDNDED
ncbi:acidic leucine-rich nuclear phosphoprotein 32-related protein-like [Solanum pennellii]|uniref:Acidic leucine-rich nuclear phosphoprotein 32-related protein-like n=1 Tax=Solanum pennellii TaxID=28526 RepID=A0ABM1VBW7_SOLPN|nr:acidic leucine-rich nuclear phosphoprotein 32-related protein-like [Solanum pennellii]